MGRPFAIADLMLEQSDEDRIEFRVGKFDIRVVHTDEGIVIDVYPFNELFATEEPIGSMYLFDEDAEAEEDEFEGHAGDCEIRLTDAGICTCGVGR